MHALTYLLFLAIAPAPVQREWKPADPAVACADASDKALCAELLAMRDRDQLARYAAVNKGVKEGSDPEIAKVDKANLAELEPILAKHGWPSRALVGKTAVAAPWTIIQHSTLEVQKKYLDLMKGAADRGDLSWALLATTIDRIQVREGKPQTYGTQFHEVDGELMPEAIEDEAHVDERRAKVGLQPLAEYTALMREMYTRPREKKE